MDTPDPSPTPPSPPDKRHLEITQNDVATCFRPWAAPTPASPSDPAAPRPPDEDPLDPIFTDDTLHALVAALPAATADTPASKLRRKVAAMHLLRSLDAQQPVEAALATQAVIFHYAAKAALRRAAAPDQFSDIIGREMASAAKASSQFSRLLHELAWKQKQVPNMVPPRSKPRWRR
jgi:hypothetical protein